MDLRRGLETTGTLACMAPEQLTGEPHLVGARTEIYSLGLVLYELLTGRRPHQASTPSSWKEQVLTRDPTRPRSINADVPRELERICLRCLTRRAEDRYANASQLALDLRKFLKGRWSFQKLLRTSVVMFVMVATMTSLWLWRRKTTEPSLDTQKEPVQIPISTTTPIPGLQPPPKVAPVLLRFENAPVGEVMRLQGHTEGVMSVAFSPDGRFAISGSRDKTIRIWDLGTGEEVRRCEGHRLGI